MPVKSRTAAVAIILPDTAGNVLVPGNDDDLNGTTAIVQASDGPTRPFTVRRHFLSVCRGLRVFRELTRGPTS